jgi:hypothetical protein
MIVSPLAYRDLDLFLPLRLPVDLLLGLASKFETGAAAASKFETGAAAAGAAGAERAEFRPLEEPSPPFPVIHAGSVIPFPRPAIFLMLDEFVSWLLKMLLSKINILCVVKACVSM